jgi:hypothetical protein
VVYCKQAWEKGSRVRRALQYRDKHGHRPFLLPPVTRSSLVRISFSARRHALYLSGRLAMFKWFYCFLPWFQSRALATEPLSSLSFGFAVLHISILLQRIPQPSYRASEFHAFFLSCRLPVLLGHGLRPPSFCRAGLTSMDAKAPELRVYPQLNFRGILHVGNIICLKMHKNRAKYIPPMCQ